MNRSTPDIPDDLREKLRRIRRDGERAGIRSSGIYTRDDVDAQTIYGPRRVPFQYALVNDHLECQRCLAMMDLYVAVSNDGIFVQKNWQCPKCKERATSTFRTPVIEELP